MKQWRSNTRWWCETEDFAVNGFLLKHVSSTCVWTLLFHFYFWSISCSQGMKNIYRFNLFIKKKKIYFVCFPPDLLFLTQKSSFPPKMGKRGGKQTLKKVCALKKLKAFAQHSCSNWPADLGKKLRYFEDPTVKVDI